MRLRRDGLALAVLTSLTLFLGACASPAPGTTVASSSVTSEPRDCEPQTGTRVPASCTKPRARAATAAAAEGGEAPVTK
jgi:hypothetical protein